MMTFRRLPTSAPLLLLASLAVSSPAADDLVLLELEIPKPMFVGSPTNDDILPNLEPPIVTIERETMVAPGTKLLSIGAPVTSSSKGTPEHGALDFITDGEKSADANHLVELAAGLQWVQIDLGTSIDIQAIGVWHNFRGIRAYKDVIVQVADDPDFKSGVTTLFNSDHDNSAGLGTGKNAAYLETNHGRVIPGGGTNARHVRLYSNGNSSDDYNHYVEVEVHGKSL